MDLLSEFMEKVSLNNFDIGSSYWVDVTHINNPHSFFVRPTSYRSLMSSIQNYTEEIAASELHIHSMIAFKAEDPSDYIRGLIIYIDKLDDIVKYNIYALDYGFVKDSVPIENIRKLKLINCQIPPLATHCQLASCKPYGETWTENSIEAMKCYIGKERAKMIIKEKTSEILVVELINTCPDDISTMLALTGYTTLGYSGNEINRLTVPVCEKLYFTFKDLKVDEVLHVRVQSGKSLKGFFVAEVKEYKHYLEERINFSFYCKKQKNVCIEDVMVGSPVGVYVDGTSKYERAIVQKVDVKENKATVQLVDWGTVVDVHINRITVMLDKFFFYPATAIYCATEESQIWNNGLQKFLHPGYEFLMTVKEVGDKFSSPNIVNLSRVS